MLMPSASPTSRCRLPRRSLASVALTLALLVAGTACAPPVDEAARARQEALDLIALADALYANREWEAARLHYRRAYETSARPGALLGMARCLIAQDRLGEAAPILDDVIAASPDLREAALLRQKVRAVLVRREIEQGDAPAASPPAATSPSATTPPPATNAASAAPSSPAPAVTPPSEAAGAAAPPAAAEAASSPEAVAPMPATEPSAVTPTPPADAAAAPEARPVLDDPALARRDSLASRRQRDDIASEADYPSAQNVAKAREAVAAYDSEEERRSVSELRTLLAEEAALERPALPPDEAIAAAWFGVGEPPVERGLEADRLADDAAFYVERARTLAADGRLVEARAALMEAIERDPRDAAAFVELGALYDRLGEKERAQEQYEAALALAPDLPRAWYRLGNSFLGQGYSRQWAEGYRRALKAYDRALALQPDYTFALNNKATAHMELGEFDAARDALIKATRLDPGYAAPYRNLGIIAERHDKNLVRALSYYKEYIALRGPDAANVGSWVREIERELAGR